MTRWTAKLGMTAVAATLTFTSVALADFADWDSDANGTITQDEFNTGFREQGVFETWDADSDGRINREEFASGYGNRRGEFNERFGENAFGAWDEDEDGNLSEDEFGNGLYAGYDDNESGVIEEPELGDVGDDMGDQGLFDV